jgi:hypothetical protein
MILTQGFSLTTLFRFSQTIFQLTRKRVFGFWYAVSVLATLNENISDTSKGTAASNAWQKQRFDHLKSACKLSSEVAKTGTTLTQSRSLLRFMTRAQNQRIERLPVQAGYFTGSITKRIGAG